MTISRRFVVNSSLAVIAAIIGGYILVAHPFSATNTAAATQLTATVKRGAGTITSVDGSTVKVTTLRGTTVTRSTSAAAAVAEGATGFGGHT